MMSLTTAARWTFEPHGSGVPFKCVRQLTLGSMLFPTCPAHPSPTRQDEGSWSIKAGAPRSPDPMIVISTCFPFHSKKLP